VNPILNLSRKDADSVTILVLTSAKKEHAHRGKKAEALVKLDPLTETRTLESFLL
jgi:hypothetical protein